VPQGRIRRKKGYEERKDMSWKGKKWISKGEERRGGYDMMG
jgi:hypothetical protein